MSSVPPPQSGRYCLLDMDESHIHLDEINKIIEDYGFNVNDKTVKSCIDTLKSNSVDSRIDSCSFLNLVNKPEFSLLSKIVHRDLVGRWGVSICTVDGQRFSVGDAHVPFCMQSTSKTLNYALAITELGSERVHEFVGYEPSGTTFNAIQLNHEDKPHNPLINSGAIIICSLLKQNLDRPAQFEYVIRQYRRLCGYETMSFNNSVADCPASRLCPAAVFWSSPTSWALGSGRHLWTAREFLVEPYNLLWSSWSGSISIISTLF